MLSAPAELLYARAGVVVAGAAGAAGATQPQAQRTQKQAHGTEKQAPCTQKQPRGTEVGTQDTTRPADACRNRRGIENPAIVLGDRACVVVGQAGHFPGVDACAGFTAAHSRAFFDGR